MTPDALAAHLKEATGAIERDEDAFGKLAVTVAPARWREVASHLRECGKCSFDFMTYLSAVDRKDDGIEVLLHLWSVRREHHITVSALVTGAEPSLPSVADIWGGANWHERETHELFGVVFDGHPNLSKLLLPDNFEGFPLRKSFGLMTREAKEWPGLKEPE